MEEENKNKRERNEEESKSDVKDKNTKRVSNRGDERKERTGDVSYSVYVGRQGRQGGHFEKKKKEMENNSAAVDPFRPKLFASFYYTRTSIN